ncbi:MAG: DNA-packaging protein [Ruminococcus sp.]|nr:DNA-packaging protein [Ruminococcus sp.]
MAILDDVKTACRVMDPDGVFDDELNRLINAAQLDLGVAGVVVPAPLDDLVKTAVCTYCKFNFGIPEDAERLKRSYDEQKAQLVTCTGYTDWLGVDDNV